MNKDSKARAVALTALTVMTASALLSGCGANNSPAAGNNTDLQSNSTQSDSSASQENAQAPENTVKFPDAKADTGSYANGQYKAEGTYGIESKNKLSVTLTVADGKVADLNVDSQGSGEISQKYSKEFVKQINAQVVGKDLKDLRVDIVAGASWTTEAFNQALTNVRGDASAVETAAQ